MTHVDDFTCDIYCVLMTWCPLTHHVLMTDVWHPALQWLTAHPWLDVLTSHYSPVSWLDIQTHTTCWWFMLMTWHRTYTVYWWHDVRSLTMCWWRRSMTPFSIMTHCLSMTWRRDVSLLNDDLTWHWNTHCMLVTYVDDLTSDIHCVLITWCPLTHYVLMTLTYDILRYNDSLPIHDLTSWRLTTQRWLDIETPTVC